MSTREKTEALTLLSGMHRVFAESADYESTLAAIAHLVLPHLGSWCAVDVCEEDGTMRRVAVIHPDSAKRPLVQALEKGWPPEVDDPLGVPAVMRTRRTVAIPRVTEQLLRQAARTPENLHALLALGIGSVITVPLLSRDSVLGAITFVSDAQGRDYDASDVALAEALAGIAALALDNARLYRGALGRAKEESAGQARSEFLATMSHEFRTPLNAIVGYAELLELGLGGPLSAKQHEYVEKLRLSGTHLSGLVNDVLDLAKTDAGKLAVAGERRSTQTAVAAAISMTLPTAHAADVRIVDVEKAGSSDRERVFYVGDERRVRQILVNLLANAVKFTPSGGTVTVECETLTEPAVAPGGMGTGPWAFIRVVDSGPGIQPEQQELVFEPFVQGDGGYKRSNGGTGLGLTIGRRLARLMGGDLVLEPSSSGAKHGAAFTLWLPAAKAAGVGAVHDSEALVESLASASPAAVFRVYGLAEIGRYLRSRVEDVLVAIATRLRTDPRFPSAAGLSASEVEDHQFSFLVDVVHSLIVIDETGGVDSYLYRAGSEIQRVVSALHGSVRHQQGWTAKQLESESTIVLEELQAFVRRHASDSTGDVTAALAVIEHLVRQAQEESASAFRQAKQRGDSVLRTQSARSK